MKRGKPLSAQLDTDELDQMGIAIRLPVTVLHKLGLPARLAEDVGAIDPERCELEPEDPAYTAILAVATKISGMIGTGAARCYEAYSFVRQVIKEFRRRK